MVTKAIISIEFTDEKTGEISVQSFDITELAAKSIKKTKVKAPKSTLFEDSTPKLVLENTKYTLSTGAMKMLNVKQGDKLSINYQKIGKTEFPVIGLSTAFGEGTGSTLSKNGTVRFSGNKQEMLETFGNEFILVNHPNSGNIFILTKDGSLPEIDYTVSSLNESTKQQASVKLEKKEETVELPQPEPENDSKDDLDLDDLLNGSDDAKVNDFSL